MDEQNIQSTGHSKSLRLILKRARMEAGLTAPQLAELVADQLRRMGEPDADPPHPNTIYAWERFDRHPSIASFAAWARALGFRLIVDLDGLDSGRVPVLLRTTEAAEIARKVDLMEEGQRKTIAEMIRLMK